MRYSGKSPKGALCVRFYHRVDNSDKLSRYFITLGRLDNKLGCKDFFNIRHVVILFLGDICPLQIVDHFVTDFFYKCSITVCIEEVETHFCHFVLRIESFLVCGIFVRVACYLISSGAGSVGRVGHKVHRQELRLAQSFAVAAGSDILLAGTANECQTGNH